MDTIGVRSDTCKGVGSKTYVRVYVLRGIPKVSAMMHHGGMSNNEEMNAALVASLAAEIASERLARRMTQEEVYERAGISKSAYLKFENGQPGSARKFTDIVQIAEALGLTLTELMSRAEQGAPLFEGALSRISEAEREDLRRVRGEIRPSAAQARKPRLKRVPTRETGT
jgi:transcriptional regulator with XRE-family HTH domain